jgi:hypothetical protein
LWLCAEKVKDTNGNFISEIKVDAETGAQEVVYKSQHVKSSVTTLPFIKNLDIDYRWLVKYPSRRMGEVGSWLLFALIINFHNYLGVKRDKPFRRA